MRYAWPGRHLQAMAAASGAGARWVRRAHRNESVRTGWALYAEQLLFDHGLATTPEQSLMRLLEQVRRSLLALLDIELHVPGFALSGALLQLEALPGYGRPAAERELLQLTRNPGDAFAALINWQLLQGLRRWYVDRQSGGKDLAPLHRDLPSSEADAHGVATSRHDDTRRVGLPQHVADVLGPGPDLVDLGPRDQAAAYRHRLHFLT